MLLSARVVWSEDRKPAGSSGQTASPQCPGSPPHHHHQLPGKGAPLLLPFLCHSLLPSFIFLSFFSAFLLSPCVFSFFLSFPLISSPVCPALLFSLCALCPSHLSPSPVRLPLLVHFLIHRCFTLTCHLSLLQPSSPPHVSNTQYNINIRIYTSQHADFQL